MVGSQLWPGWETVRVIGNGGFGKVYEIRKADGDDTGEYHSALKVITIPQSPEDYRAYEDDGYDAKSIRAIFKSQVDDIVSESRMMSQFRGTSNIVSYEDHKIVPHEDGRGWDILIRMELLTALPEYFNQRGMSEADTVKLGQDICQALELCGRSGIVHRDIKPQNIFVNQFGNFKLGDFGIAKSMDHTTMATKIGTYHYMAPEVYRNTPYGASVDIYSLGLVMYWLLNERRLPFAPMPPAVPTAAQNNEAQMRRLGGETLPPPKHGSPALKEAVLKACSFEANRRFASPEAFRRALEACAQGQTACAVPPGNGYETVADAEAASNTAPEASGEETAYTTGAWSMKSSPVEGGWRYQSDPVKDSRRASFDDSDPDDIHWTPEPEPTDRSADGPEPAKPPRSEDRPPKSDSPAGKDSTKTVKKQRRAIRLWAVWLFFWVGGGLEGILMGPDNSRMFLVPFFIAIGIIPFAVKATRILKDSNHNPLVRRTFVTSLCVVAILFALSLYGYLAEQRIQDSLDASVSSDVSASSDASDTVNHEIPYTKGTFDGAVYRNEWADLYFSLPDGFENALEDYYALYDDDENTECGLFLISATDERIIVCFEELHGVQITERIYLDALVRNAKLSLQDQDISIETGITTPWEVFIGSQSYLADRFNLIYGDTTAVSSIYVRKIDDRMCVIQIVGASGEANDALVGSLGVADSNYEMLDKINQIMSEGSLT